MTDSNAENEETAVKTVRGNARDAKRGKDRLPPELEPWQRILCNVSVYSGFILVLFVLAQLSFNQISILDVELSSVNLTYVASGFVLTALILSLYLRHDQFVHEARLEDRSEVEAKIAEAYEIEPWLAGTRQNRDYAPENASLVAVVEELESLRQEAWTEFQVLPLDKSLVNFLHTDPLKARALTTLAYLEEYGGDRTTRYDQRQFDRWKGRIDGAVGEIEKTIEKTPDDPSILRQVDDLRARLKELLEETAHYDADWATGKVILRTLVICGVTAIIILLVMGLLPILHPLGDKKFTIMHWGLFGSVGALIVVFREIRNSDLVELGNSDATREVLRAFIGAVLGMVAGVVVYSLVGGMVLKGNLFPIIDDTSLNNVSLSIFIGLAAGYSFERIYDRMSSVSETGS